MPRRRATRTATPDTRLPLLSPDTPWSKSTLEQAFEMTHGWRGVLYRFFLDWRTLSHPNLAMKCFVLVGCLCLCACIPVGNWDGTVKNYLDIPSRDDDVDEIVRVLQETKQTYYGINVISCFRLNTLIPLLARTKNTSINFFEELLGHKVSSYLTA